MPYHSTINYVSIWPNRSGSSTFTEFLLISRVLTCMGKLFSYPYMSEKASNILSTASDVFLSYFATLASVVALLIGTFCKNILRNSEHFSDTCMSKTRGSMVLLTLT